MKTKNMNFKAALFLLLAIALLISYACSTDVADSSQSGSLLIVSAIEGQPGGEGEEAGTPLLSDTCDNDSTLPQDPEFCTVFNDNADIEFSNEYLQIGPGAGFNPTYMNDVIVNQYRIDYVRPNNRNTPGVDVPFGVDGVMNLRVPINSSASASILVVRHEAKREPPLAELDNGTSEGVLTAEAQLQFFGHDIAGHELTATGLLEIHWANYGEAQ